MNSLLFSPHDLLVYGKVSLWVMLLTSALHAIGVAFGPIVKAYAPRWYNPLAMIGTAIIGLLNSAVEFAKAFVPSKPASVPIGERVTPTVRPPPLPVMLMVAALAGGCSAQQRTGECNALGVGTVALNAIASVFVSLIGDGVAIPSSVPGYLDTAGRIVSSVEHSACPLAMPPLGDRVRQAIAAHPVHVAP